MALREPKVEMKYVFCFGDYLRMHFVPKNAHYAMNKYGMNQSNPMWDLAIRRQENTVQEDGVYRVMCVRHPLDRLVSTWAFFCKSHSDKLVDETKMADCGYYRGMSFEEFCEIYEEMYECNMHTVPQVFFTGGHYIHHLFPLEKLNEAWAELSDLFGKDLVHPKIAEVGHQSKRGPWQGYYSPKMQTSLLGLLQDDLDLYEEAVNASN